ncbi:MAG: DedA family protein [Planctomycetes bacterium]|nr:DedA family protein [Planctomycetota bacterium]
MEMLAEVRIIDLFVNLKGFIDQVIRDYQYWIYAILFLIIFCETGLVVTPFLPGDSLLFVAGSFAAPLATGQQTPLDLKILMPVLFLAPMLGDSTNYWIGRFVGPKIFHKENVRFLNKNHLNRAHKFYERHGGKAVFIGRFLPIIRTFVPFVAGIGTMPYQRFLAFSISGTLAWISVCVLAGYFFGTHPFVQKHFELVIGAIIIISLIPAFVGYLQSRRPSQAEAEKKA